MARTVGCPLDLGIRIGPFRGPLIKLDSSLLNSPPLSRPATVATLTSPPLHGLKFVLLIPVVIVLLSIQWWPDWFLISPYLLYRPLDRVRRKVHLPILLV